MLRSRNFLFLALLLLIAGCDSSTDPEVSTLDIVVGTGALADGRDVVTVHYTGMFTNGEVFDTSTGRGPLTFQLETGRIPNTQSVLIEGFVQGVAGMRVGGIRRITVPPELGYGREGYASIPGNTTIVFQVELLAVQEE